MKEKLIQLKEKFLSLSNVKKVMIISGSAVVLLAGGYAASTLAGQTEKTQEVVQVAEVTTESTTTTENKELKDLQEKDFIGDSCELGFPDEADKITLEMLQDDYRKNLKSIENERVVLMTAKELLEKLLLQNSIT